MGAPIGSIGLRFGQWDSIEINGYQLVIGGVTRAQWESVEVTGAQ